MVLDIKHDRDHHQFIVLIEEKTALLKYSLLPDGKTLNYYHTFVPVELRGKNIGQEIVKFALDYAKINNMKVIPSCPFVKAYIDRHPEYKNIMSI